MGEMNLALRGASSSNHLSSKGCKIFNKSFSICARIISLGGCLCNKLEVDEGEEKEMYVVSRIGMTEYHPFTLFVRCER